jgi:hypothetical protein
MFVIGATRSRSPPMPVPEPFGQGVGRFQRRCRKGKENRDGQATDTDLGLQACRAHPPEAPRPTPKSRRPCRRNALHVARRRTSGHDYGRARCQYESSDQSASRAALTYTTPRRPSAQYVPSATENAPPPCGGAWLRRDPFDYPQPCPRTLLLSATPIVDRLHLTPSVRER